MRSLLPNIGNFKVSTSRRQGPLEGKALWQRRAVKRLPDIIAIISIDGALSPGSTGDTLFRHQAASGNIKPAGFK